MEKLFSIGPGKVVTSQIRSLFHDARVYRVRRRPTVFVCGGPTKGTEPSMRREFLDYGSDKLKRFLFFHAEKATDDILAHEAPQPIDLAEFELLLSEIADCVLIFPEREGSFTELGFFCNSDALSKILLANNIAHQDLSFINRGPKRWIEQESIFQSVILLSYQPDIDRSAEYGTIGRRLEEVLLKRKNAKRFVVDRFNKLKPIEQLALIHALIDLLRIPSLGDLTALLRLICGGGVQGNERRISHLLSILVSGGLVNRVGEELQNYVVTALEKPLLKFEREIDVIRASSLEFLQTHRPDWYTSYLEARDALEPNSA